MDFMSDALFNSRRFRTLNIIDDYNREVIWMEIGLSIGAMHMTDLLEWIIREREREREENQKQFAQIMVRSLPVLFSQTGVTNTGLK